MFRGSEMPDAKEGCGDNARPWDVMYANKESIIKDAETMNARMIAEKYQVEYHHMQNFCRKNAIFPAMVKRTRGGRTILYNSTSAEKVERVREILENGGTLLEAMLGIGCSYKILRRIIRENSIKYEDGRTRNGREAKKAKHERGNSQ